jgi:N-acetylglucosamine-6-phosphate deacetylase
MKGVTRKNAFRIGGAVEAGYYLDGMKVEIIADGCHLPTELLKMIYKFKGADNIALITDAVRAAGLPDGSTSILGSLKNGTPIIVEKGVAFLEDRQSFAGSVATYDRLFRVMAKITDNDYVNLAKMCSTTPANILGLNDRGVIEKGKRADLVLMNKENVLESVFIKGEKV